MSILGTSVAAAVAQTGLQAQQVARQRDRTHVQNVRDAQRVHAMIEAHLQALEEGEEFESPAQLHIDSNLPQHQSPKQQRQAASQQAADEAASPAEPTVNPRAAAIKPGASLYRHLDVQA